MVTGCLEIIKAPFECLTHLGLQQWLKVWEESYEYAPQKIFEKLYHRAHGYFIVCQMESEFLFRVDSQENPRILNTHG